MSGSGEEQGASPGARGDVQGVELSSKGECQAPGQIYEYAGQVLTPAMAAAIIVTIFRGRHLVKQPQLVYEAERYHRDRGGLPYSDPDDRYDWTFERRTIERLRADGIAVPMTGGMKGLWRFPPLRREPPPPKSVTLSVEDEELLDQVGIEGFIEFLAICDFHWNPCIAEEMIREHAGTMPDKELVEKILLANAIEHHADLYGHS